MEVICGELIDELRKMKLSDSASRSGGLDLLGLSPRPEEFPKSYLRGLVKRYSVSVRVTLFLCYYSVFFFSFPMSSTLSDLGFGFCFLPPESSRLDLPPTGFPVAFLIAGLRDR